MKFLFVFLMPFFLIKTTSSQGVNLIENGDFESFFLIKNLKQDSAKKNRKEKWYSCPILQSVHWNKIDPQKSFRYCIDTSICHNGYGCAAVKVYDNIDIDNNIFSYNNLIGVLKKDLIKDIEYEVSFYVKPFIGDFLSDKFEVFISDSLYQNLAYKEFKVLKEKNKFKVIKKNNFIPSFSNTGIISDTLNYTKRSFIYKAKGKERYIYFGNITGESPKNIRSIKFGYNKIKDRNPLRMLLIDDIVVKPVINQLEYVKEIKESVDSIKYHFFEETQTIFFDKNSDKVKDFYLNEIIHWLQINKYKTIDSIQIIGYASDVGSKENNKILSQKRAEKLKVIIRELKSDIPDISVFSKGEVYVENILNINEERKSNRKVEIKYFLKEKMIQIKNIHFENRSVKIMEESKETLSDLLKVLKDNINLIVELQGYICCQEFEGEFNGRNHFLSLERAKQISKFLVKNGINSERVTHKGYGSDFAIYGKNNPNHSLNRRVESIIKYKN